MALLVYLLGIGLTWPCPALLLLSASLLGLACSCLLFLALPRILPCFGLAWPCVALLGCTGQRLAVLGLAWPCLPLRGFLLGPAGPYLALLGLTYPCLSCHVRCPLNIPMISIIPSINNVFLQQKNFAMGSLAQIGSGAIGCSFNTRFRTRFRRVLVQIPREVPEGSGADTW